MILLQKLILFISGFILLYQQFTGVFPVIVFLVAISIGCFQTYLEKMTLFLSLSSIVYLVFCIWNNQFCFFIPLLMYELFSRKIWIVIALCVGTAIYALHEQPFILLFILLMCSVSFMFQYHLTQNEALKSKLKSIRDDSEELAIELKNKNKNLIDKQDYEIYLATLKERNRIAREIHDNVGHMLSRSILQTGAMMVLNKDQKLDGQFSDLKDTLNVAMDSIRQSVHGLRDESLDLYASIQQLINCMPEYDIQLDYDTGEDVPANIKYCFIAVIKEAISNTIRHSNSNTIRLIIREHPSIYQLIIQDYGTEAKVKIGGMGLANMQERVETLGGTFYINTEDGFRIFISISKDKAGNE